MINVAVLLLILVILAALVLPAVQQAREAARRSKCKSYFKQIGLALMNYHDVHRTLPPGVVVSQLPTPSGGNHLGWGYQILGFYGKAPLMDLFNPNLDITSTGPKSNSESAGTILPSMRCPSDHGPDQDVSGSFGESFQMGTSNYVGNFGVGYPSLNMHPEDCQGVMGPNSGVRIQDVKDGMSNIILVAERRNPQKGCRKFVTTDLGLEPPFGGGCTFWAGSGNAQSDLMAKVEPMQGGAIPAIPLFQILGTTRSGVVNDPAENSHEGSLGPGAILWDTAPGTIRINKTIARLDGTNTVVQISGEYQDRTTVGFSSWHRGGIQALLGDGTVRFLNDNIDVDIYQNLARRSDGLVLDDF